MKISRLRLHGFKSFVEPSDIAILPGVTGVVGPNGCGKSNLVEALRFVMGESSYKAMRGGGMEDVIFSGSGNRPARNMAEVTLVLERDAGGGEGPETLEVTRRIEREAGSSFRMNGREVRARDVQLLFADAATGAHSSALVRQGQIAELIAAKPVQRRSILEDAAGISGLHARRNEAELKLKAAEGNLERLDDVMSEIAAQLEGLRRQARQAVRYRRISGEIRKGEAVLAVLHWETALARLAETEAELAAAREAHTAAVGAQVEAAKAEAAAAERLPELRENSAAAEAELQAARRAVQELDREESELKARRQELTARRAQAELDLKREAEIGSDAAAATQRLDAEDARLAAAGATAAAAIAAARTRAEEAAAAVTAREAEFSAAAGALAAAAAERGARERTMREAQGKLRRLEEERAGVLAERDKLQGEQGGDADAKQAADALAQAEAALAASETEIAATETALASTRETEQRARGPYEAAERHLSALEAEARTLADLLDLDTPKRFAPLIDSLAVPAGYEEALAAAFGEDLDIPLDPAAPAHWGACASAGTDPPLPAGVEPLADAIKGPENLARRLRQIGVATPESAAELAPALAPGQQLVTRDGALWRWDGLRVQAGTATAAARKLEQRNRVNLLMGELKSARQAVDEASELLETVKEVRGDAERLEAEGRKAVRQARENVEAHRRAVAEAVRRQSRVAERLSAYAGALARIESDMEATRIELRAATEALESLAPTAELQARRDTLQTELAQDRGRAAETRLEAEKAAHEEIVRSRRAAELKAERDGWAARVARAEERIGELKERLARLDADVAALADDPGAFAERRESLAAATNGGEEAAMAARAALAVAESEHRAGAEAARAALEAVSQARETRARDEERALGAAARREELAEQIREQFGRPAADLRVLAELAPNVPLPPVDSVEARLHRMRAERERLGGVNLRAEDEAKEIETRLDAMRAERLDLEEAIKRLRVGIQTLNREGRERLLTAFEAVNGHFSSLFQHLFGGGTAELTLIGSDDPLEAGLEITARPPGKRPQTMTLLSGGEQALTAMSLIFAVFLTNPSPICVLDEVDAPLDDANVDRFCALLDDMRKRTDTRFLVVTHNPITMARMDRLYGVTMAERGVSQVVSVDLEAAERFREAS